MTVHRKSTSLLFARWPFAVLLWSQALASPSSNPRCLPIDWLPGLWHVHQFAFSWLALCLVSADASFLKQSVIALLI